MTIERQKLLDLYKEVYLQFAEAKNKMEELRQKIDIEQGRIILAKSIMGDIAKAGDITDNERTILHLDVDIDLLPDL